MSDRPRIEDDSSLPHRDLLDAGAIGGHALHDLITGRVGDADLDPVIVEAFARQYPALAETTTFCERVCELSSDPDRLDGFLYGVRGKLFELHAVEALNDGGLPEGHVARLADSATQPGYDIELVDESGEIVSLLQVKTNPGNVAEHLGSYPGVEQVVVPAEQTDGTVDSVIPLGPTIDALDSDVEEAATSALEVPYGIPWIAGAMIAADLIMQARRGASMQSMTEAAGVRLVGCGAAISTIHLVSSAGGPVAIGAGMLVRLGVGHGAKRLRASIERDQATLSRRLQEHRVEKAVVEVQAEVLRQALNGGEKGRQ